MKVIYTFISNIFLSTSASFESSMRIAIIQLGIQSPEYTPWFSEMIYLGPLHMTYQVSLLINTDSWVPPQI